MTEKKDSIQVIGAGCCRTGTASLKKALEILGYDPCYHMLEVMENHHFDFWKKVVQKKTHDFDEAFVTETKTYKASCDFPSSLFWKEQLVRYPDAKVILTRRDPEKWYKSMTETVFTVMPTGPFSLLGVRVFNFVGFGPMLDEVMTHFLHDNWEKESILASFNDHNASVIAECPADKLLVYEAGQGWEPICTFLGKPIPDVPYPNVNDTAAFQKRVVIINIAGYTLLVLIALPVVSLSWYASVRGGGMMHKSVTC
jgi:hypothetical protein